MSLGNIAASLFPAVTGGMVAPAGAASQTGSTGGFGDVLKNAVGQVNNLETSAEQQVSGLLQGGNIDMSKVMISVEKADVAFQLMMQVRNKIVSAYQDIEKMQF